MTAIALVPKGDEASSSPADDAREGLLAAFRVRQEAREAAEEARQASGRARAYVAESANALERLTEADQALTSARAGEVRRALQAGARPAARAEDAPSLALELHDARSHLDAARLAK